MTLLTSSRPDWGVGALRDREGGGSAFLYTKSSAEKTLYTPIQWMNAKHNGTDNSKQDERACVFYRTLGNECHKANISCDIVVTTPLGHEVGSGRMGKNYLDVSTLSEFCRVTCGKFKWLKVEDCHVLSRRNYEGSYCLQLREELM